MITCLRDGDLASTGYFYDRTVPKEGLEATEHRREVTANRSMRVSDPALELIHKRCLRRALQFADQALVLLS